MTDEALHFVSGKAAEGQASANRAASPFELFVRVLLGDPTDDRFQFLVRWSKLEAAHEAKAGRVSVDKTEAAAYRLVYRAARKEAAQFRATGPIEGKTRWERAFQGLATLRHRQRAAVALRFIAGLSVADVAEVLGVRDAQARGVVEAGVAGIVRAVGGPIDVRRALRIAAQRMTAPPKAAEPPAPAPVPMPRGVVRALIAPPEPGGPIPLPAEGVSVVEALIAPLTVEQPGESPATGEVRAEPPAEGAEKAQVEASEPVAFDPPVDMAALPVVPPPADIAELLEAVSSTPPAEPVAVQEPVAVEEPVVVEERVVLEEPVAVEPADVVVEEPDLVVLESPGAAHPAKEAPELVALESVPELGPVTTDAADSVAVSPAAEISAPEPAAEISEPEPAAEMESAEPEPEIVEPFVAELIVDVPSAVAGETAGDEPEAGATIIELPVRGETVSEPAPQEATDVVAASVAAEAEPHEVARAAPAREPIPREIIPLRRAAAPRRWTPGRFIAAALAIGLLVAVALVPATAGTTEKPEAARAPIVASGAIASASEDPSWLEARRMFAVLPLPESVVVRRGDSLWSIAARTLGDGFRWPEIWRLNRGRSMPWGERFDDPAIIRPGWRLELPD